MKRQHAGLLIIWLVFLSGIRIAPVAAQGVPASSIQATGDVPLQIQLRYSDGTAVSDEPLTLQRLPDMEETTCITDGNGSCTWTVARGLYQIIFSQPLDAISSLAVAEGGLDGFGLTVGDAPINYYFTFHHDDHVYFDAAPESAVPDPIIPTANSLHGGIVPTAVSATAVASTTVAIAASASIAEAAPPSAVPDEMPHTGEQPTDSVAAQPTNPLWRLLLLIILGLALGGGLHLWSRKRQQRAERTEDRTAIEQRLTAFVSPPSTEVGTSPATQATVHSSVQTGGSEC